MHEPAVEAHLCVASRRAVLRAAAVVGATWLPALGLSACGADTGTVQARPDSGEAGAALAKTSDIPVGGGRIFGQQKVVVTQPEQGDFRGFSAVCTHQGCIVGEVVGGTINCPCHGSRFRIADGAVEAGPAPRPLPRRNLRVAGDTIALV